MEFIGIFIVVCIIYYFKKKKEERESANEFQIQPDFSETPREFDTNVSNPFVSEESLTEESNFESTDQVNPFIQNATEETYYEEDEEYCANGYAFPECPVNDKNFSNSLKNNVKIFSYENENYAAVSYGLSGKNLLLFQKIINENGGKKYHLVDYGYLWLKLLKTYTKAMSVLPHELQKYDNLKEMPNVPDEQLENLYEIEKDVKSIYNDVEQIPLTFSDGTEKVFWKFGDVIFGNNTYHFLVSQTNPDDAEVFKVTFNGEGNSYDAVTNPSTLDLVWKAFHKKYDN